MVGGWHRKEGRMGERQRRYKEAEIGRTSGLLKKAASWHWTESRGCHCEEDCQNAAVRKSNAPTPDAIPSIKAADRGKS